MDFSGKMTAYFGTADQIGYAIIFKMQWVFWKSGSKTDPIITPIELCNWQNWLKSGDKIWECAEGHHFFHSFYPEKCVQKILDFWQRIDPMLFIEAERLMKLTLN
ncbi:hypothetical protein CK510_16845 [Brunnivagina elsteri CCALA 953]|uniref:Alpha/beta hydrolase n=1 Tax=Brunnivagina elsteri CCALA 953 TaxID=987040 RepID=A0A2A2TGL1_9CYAN|nr:hypothetical protein CK510_16845 [Calothrix elsteri CCALA 953]